MAEHQAGVAAGPDRPGAELHLVDAQPQDQVVELPAHRQRPERRAQRVHARRVRRRLAPGAAHRDRHQAGLPVEVRGHVRVADVSLADLPGQRGELDAGPARQAPGPGGGGPCPLAHGGVEPARGRDLVDQAPGLRGLAAHALAAGGDHVGEVLADPALVHQPGEAARARQHRQQRHLRHGHGGRAVVDQDDLVAGEGELVPAAGGGAVDRREVGLAGVLGRVLDRAPRLVGELAEVHLPPVLGLGEHPDVRARAEHLVQPAGDDHGAHLRVLEPQPLHRVGQLDVNAEVVGVELELVAGAQAAGLVDGQHDPRDLAVGLQPQVTVTARVGVERHRRYAGHGTPPSGPVGARGSILNI